jgi:hypothetical protein
MRKIVEFPCFQTTESDNPTSFDAISLGLPIIANDAALDWIGQFGSGAAGLYGTLDLIEA